ncbi:hypothetical protein [Paenibacillus mesophilus]|uniref:hypothetical protein n=1 Tax=Paenibacillus mesophilus TaxID=2582849 RepID=UPI00130521A1|nr:hypothetical protein [Paenibacillus mesophilus]
MSWKQKCSATGFIAAAAFVIAAAAAFVIAAATAVKAHNEREPKTLAGAVPVPPARKRPRRCCSPNCNGTIP